MIPSPQMQPQRPRLPVSTSSGTGSSSANNANIGTVGNSPASSTTPVPFYNVHQPSARSPLSQETTPFGLFRHKNLSTSALPTTQSPASSSSNLALAPVTSASTTSYSPNSSYTNLADSYNASQKNIDPTSRQNATYSPSTPLPPPLQLHAKMNNTSSSPKINGRPSSFQYVAQYYAWWDYIAREHDELSFKKGDILLVSREFDDLWCLGSVMRPDKRTSARHGFFPLQYCSLESQCYVPATRVAARSGTIPGTEPGGRLSIVHPFNATAQDELTLRPGNQVRLIHVFDDGWVLGEQIDHAGVVIAVGAFPASVAKPVTAIVLESLAAASGGATLAGAVAASVSSPSKQRHGSSPLVPTAQDIGLIKLSRQREESNGSTGPYNALYSHQNSSGHLLQYHTNGSSINSSTSTIKLPGSPTSSPFAPGQSHRASPPIISARSPLSGTESSRTNPHPNRTSIQSLNDGKRNGNNNNSSNSNNNNGATSPTVTEEQVIRALQDRPAQDAILQLYLAQKGDPNIVDANGNSLLHLAIIAHSQASLVFLLNAPDIRLEHGSPISPLYTAVRFRSWKAAQQLLIQGADPNVHDERGLSVLHVVLLFMTKGDTLAEEVVHLLCENKADVNCVANDKRVIPLSIAVERELWAEVEILMAYGANPHLIWGRDRRQSIGLGQMDGVGAITNGNTNNNALTALATTTSYFNDPLWEAVNDDKVHLVRLLLKFYYAPTSFAATAAATSSSPSPSPSSTQSSQSFFGPQHSFLHHSSASSFTTNNGSSTNINIPNIPHGASVPMPFAGNGVGGPGTPPSIPSPSSAQSSPGSAALVGYMSQRANAADSVGSPKLATLPGGSGHVGSFTNASANPNMVGGSNPIYVITPKVLLQALTLAKDLGHNDCLQVLSRPEVTLKEGTLYGTGSYGYNQLHSQSFYGPFHNGPGHGSGGANGNHGGGKEHRNLIQKLTSLFK
ncbi:Intersectin 1 (SH3 domain protein) [Lobosporangium transversale]|uniref:SH3 domain-containing protein n=1 Tax=Lobosporangium transversale TaxID=64571 RepID=A0A1Y2GNR9_9FUNG|nr:hypothetical protein BCR41DRAFT_57032 [Lobosporangium transversale]KAF9913205.1 Intersectin 1 (SH3 domain protein) [Lobosporangium transversale]ORZ16823.1 hypothetical protein BCR41DRAFT_57032 [Lobosporangium transversale]|eukprot:XP_021881758.1 hypothetical protein BCR41DRAFT_57032 [Lobosporangium transversale]